MHLHERSKQLPPLLAGEGWGGVNPRLKLPNWMTALLSKKRCP